jgi:hypothetical protein
MSPGPPEGEPGDGKTCEGEEEGWTIRDRGLRMDPAESRLGVGLWLNW